MTINRSTPYRSRTFLPVCCALVVAAATATVEGSMVRQLDLEGLCASAHKIYRGTILAATSGSVMVGGGQLPTVTYRVKVDELFRGDVAIVKGVRVAEIRMIGKQEPARYGNLLHFPLLPRMPELTVGLDYLLFATQPSKVGLSTTVGLGQGRFRIVGTGPNETAVNEQNNRGLLRADVARGTARGAAQSDAATEGPILYRDLSGRIRARVVRER